MRKFCQKSLWKGVPVGLDKRESRGSVLGGITIQKHFSRNRVERKLQTQASRIIKAKKWRKVPERAQQLQKIPRHLRRKAGGRTQ